LDVVVDLGRSSVEVDVDGGVQVHVQVNDQVNVSDAAC